MQINYASVDWITATSKDDQVGLGWYRLFQTWLKHNKGRDLLDSQWSNGYYSGIELAGLRWGYNVNLGYILIASSDTAAWLWRHIQPRPVKVTRMDLCVDVILAKPRDLAMDGYKEMCDIDPKAGVKASVYQNRDGGRTLYVGSRQHYQFGRLYDKGIESGLMEQGKMWRYEVEYKKPLSMQIAEHVSLMEGYELEKEITNRVGHWFDDRRVSSGADLVEGIVKPILVQKTTSTIDRKLGWLRTQVQPTVHQLVESGHGIDVLHSLLLTPKQIKEILGDDI